MTKRNTLGRNEIASAAMPRMEVTPNLMRMLVKGLVCCASVAFADIDAQALEQTNMRVHDLAVSDSSDAMELADADSIEFIGPNVASLTVPCDATLNNVSVAPYKGVKTFYSDCLMSTNTLIWRNVSLEDVTSFSAVMGGSGVGNAWRTPQFIGNNTTNSVGDITVQYQYLNGPLYMVAVTYSQSGADVVARVSKCLYQYGRALGFSFSSLGSSRTLTNTVNGAHLAIRDLGCTLRDAADQPHVETLELANMDDDEAAYPMVAVHSDCLTGTDAVLWEDTDLSKVTAFSAQISGGPVMGTTWRDVSAYCFKTNTDGSITCQFQYVKLPASANILYSATVNLYQSGLNVRARVLRIAYQYYKEPGTDLSQIGTVVTIGTEPSSSVYALRNISGTWERPYRYEYGTAYSHCLTNIEATIWRDVRLEDVIGFSARLGGRRADSQWRPAKSYNQKTNTTTGAITCQFQWYSGYTRCAIVEFKQSGDDVVARVTRTCYQYDPLGSDLSTKGSSVTCVDTVDGNGLAISDITCIRFRRNPHMVTFNGFSPNSLPKVALADIDLALAGTTRGDAVLPPSVVGRGTVKAGYVTVTNVCAITADGGLATLPGGTLCFDMTAAPGVVPSITASRATLSPGTCIVLAGDSAFPDALNGEPLKLVVGGGLGADVLQGLALSFDGRLKGRCRGTLCMDDDGDLSVTVRKIRGIVFSVR